MEKFRLLLCKKQKGGIAAYAENAVHVTKKQNTSIHNILFLFTQI